MAQSYIQNLRRYAKSGIGLIAVRTRDSMATASDTSVYCAQSSKPIRIWDPARGFIKGDDPVAGEPMGSLDHLNLISVFQSLLAPATGENFAGEEEYPKNGFFVFMNPHLLIPATGAPPVMLQLLSLLAHNLPFSERRVVLCVPTGYQFPAELQELIPIIEDQPPNVEALCESADVTLSDYRERAPKRVPRYTPEDLLMIAQAGVGMILPEFEGGLSRCLNSLIDNKEDAIPSEVRKLMLTEKAAMVSRNPSLEVMDPVDLSEVGGLGKLKKWISKRAVTLDPKAWASGVAKPKGCALVGPPGTGKSLCAKVIGTSLGLATVRFDLSSVFAGLVGQSESNMREALFMIKSLAPCVVMLDEIDKAISVNGGGDGGTSQKVLGTLLTFMQENDEAIFWVPTLNRTANVPAEFLRPGRIDQVFAVNVPNAEERREILTIHFKKHMVDVDAFDPEWMQDLVDMTDQYVGAELQAIAAEAQLNAYVEGGGQFEWENITEAHSEIRPLSKRMAAQFVEMQTWCEQHATPSSVPASITTTTRRRKKVAVH